VIRRIFPVLLAFALLLPSAALGADKVEIYFPPDGTLMQEDVIPVEGIVKDPDLWDLEIVVNGEETYRTVVRDYLFSEEVDLEEGVNTIVVGETTHTVYFSAGSEPAPEGYRPVYGHYGLDDGCAECHEVGENGALSFDGEPEESCGWCHGELIRGMKGKDLKSVHRPVADEKCLVCHTPHLSGKPGLPVEKPPLCRDCHGETFERLDKERYVHGPLNLGDCRLCHTIHSSEEPALLNMAATVLCTQCHSDVAVRPGTPEELLPHRMIPEGECGRCHFPHSSENPMMMREPSSRICYSCHPKKTRSFHEKKGFSIYVCQKCHDLHRPTLPHLIADSSRSLCLQCHEFRTDAAFTHEFILEGGCFICHTFHEASLSDDIATICLRCHGDNPRLSEAHGGIIIGDSRCTNCHRPHQSDKGKLLYAFEHEPFGERDCASCHEELVELLDEPRRDLCLSCHDDKDMVAAKREGMTIHPPAEEEDCGYCHAVHASAEKSILKTRELDLCLTCHRKLKKVTIMKPKSSHEAVLQGECHRCHEPHASANRSFLREPLAEICPSCHEGVRNGPGGAGWASPHPPVAEGKCRLCHRAHTSRKPSLLRAEMPKACRPCHQEFFVRLDGAAREKTHKPVRDGNCGACHGVHGSEGNFLLAPEDGGALCAACHENLQGGHHLFTRTQLEEKIGPLAESANICLLCHRPHSSTEIKLLISSREELCQACHEI